MPRCRTSLRHLVRFAWIQAADPARVRSAGDAVVLLGEPDGVAGPDRAGRESHAP